MATLPVTVPSGRGGADMRRFAEKIVEASITVADQMSTGAALVYTFDNAPATGFLSVTVSGGGLPAQVAFTV